MKSERYRGLQFTFSHMVSHKSGMIHEIDESDTNDDRATGL
jgi:hypothetical protein